MKIGLSPTVTTPQYCDAYAVNGHERGRVPSFRGEFCPWVVDCAGATGRYLRVRLPGADRVVDAAPLTVTPFRVAAVGLADSQLLCHAVEVGVSNSITPEFHVTTDPRDPAFYSTCWKLVPALTWLPTSSGH
jgi:hypothetical protein